MRLFLFKSTFVVYVPAGFGHTKVQELRIRMCTIFLHLVPQHYFVLGEHVAVHPVLLWLLLR